MQQIDHEEFTGTDRFIVQRFLGKGTFGVVYQVYDRKNKSSVALKKLRKAIYEQNSETLYRFKQEFRALADISHPNLVTLYEFFSEDEIWFFTMEKVTGTSFINYIQGKKEDLDETLLTQKQPGETIEESASMTKLGSSSSSQSSSLDDVRITSNPTSTQSHTINSQIIDRLRKALYQLAEGICALHKVGKLHRDLKSSNLLVTPEGRVVILDFGLVIEYSIEQFETDLVGTPTYMSPEQAMGGAISPASDWYSFGVILFQALTGKLPFQGKVFDVLIKKQNSDAPSPNEFVKNLPSDLCQLCEELLKREPDARPSGEEILSRLQKNYKPAPNTPTSQYGNLFIGRENHLARLKEAFLNTKSGTPNVVCVSGISGMGKTSLVKHFLKQVHQEHFNDCLILSGRCYEQESVPYKVFDGLVDSLTQYLKNLPDFQLIKTLPSGFPALIRIFPVLKSVIAQNQFYQTKIEIPDTKELRRRAFTALRDLLTELAKTTTLVMFVDDLQWGDKDSAALLKEILSPPNPPPILFIATYRSEDVESSIFLQSLLTVPNNTSVNCKFLEVNKLSDEESRSLVSALLGENQEVLSVLADLIVEESIGIPFFINELIQHIPINTTGTIDHESGRLFSSRLLALGGSEKAQNPLTSLDKAIYDRISQLPLRTKQLLEIIVVAGRPTPREIAKRATGLGQEELTAVTTLRTQHLIRFRDNIRDEDEVEVYHDRIRQAVLRNLSPLDKKNYHNRLAEELEAIPETDPEVLVTHFVQTENKEKAVKYAYAAGEKANQTLAFDRAAHFYQMCLNLSSQDTPQNELKTLYIKLANVLASAGRSTEAASMFLTASENCELEEWLELQRCAGEQYLVGGLIEEGLSIFFTLINALGMVIPKTPQEALEAIISLQADIEANGLKFPEKAEGELSKNDQLQIDTCWSMVIGLTFVDTIKAAAFQAGQLFLALQIGEPYRLSRAISMEIGHRSAIGHPSKKKVSELIDFSEKLLEKVSNPHALGLYKLVLSSKAYFYGEWKDICPLTSEAEKIFREECSNVPWEIDAAHLYMFRALYFLGEIKTIAARLPIILNEVEDRGNLWMAALLQSRFYIVHLAEDNPESAQEQLNQSIRNWSSKSFYMQHYWNMFGNVEVLLYCQEGQKAWELINNSWAKLQESMLLRVQVFLLESLYLHARSALASALTSQNSERYLSIAQEDAKAIEKQEVAWATPLAFLIYASIATINRDIPSAISLLAKAETDLESVDMYLYSNSAGYLKGQLMADQEGVILQEKAIIWMKSQNIKNPARITKLLIPAKV